MFQFFAVLFLVFASQAEAERRWFVQTSDNTIVGFTDDDGGHTPDGTTAVADATIRAADPPGATGEILPLGTWDGTTYAAPSGGGIVVRIDPTTGTGRVMEAAHDLMDEFETALEYIRRNHHIWPVANVVNAREGIYWMHVNAARVALNGTRSANNRIAFLNAAAGWPSNANGEARQYVDLMSTGVTLPTENWSWVNAQSNPPAIPRAAL